MRSTIVFVIRARTIHMFPIVPSGIRTSFFGICVRHLFLHRFAHGRLAGLCDFFGFFAVLIVGRTDVTLELFRGIHKFRMEFLNEGIQLDADIAVPTPDGLREFLEHFHDAVVDIG